MGTGEAGMDETGNQAGDQGPGSTPKGPVVGAADGTSKARTGEAGAEGTVHS